MTMKEYSASITIGGAKQEELPAILALLDECDLPREGVAAHITTTIVARYEKEIVGCSALELYERYALLRSVAVKPSFRGRGLGARLTSATLDLARHHLVTAVYLLTEAASAFFAKLGFATIVRSDVPQKVRESLEFTTLCPDTATVMTISLGQPSR
jgi:amino-acid N-acetyltransferase